MELHITYSSLGTLWKGVLHDYENEVNDGDDGKYDFIHNGYNDQMKMMLQAMSIITQLKIINNHYIDVFDLQKSPPRKLLLSIIASYTFWNWSIQVMLY